MKGGELWRGSEGGKEGEGEVRGKVEGKRVEKRVTERGGKGGGSKCKEWEGSREGIETGMGSYMQERRCLGAGRMHGGVQED